jgi:hypothetical protein
MTVKLLSPLSKSLELLTGGYLCGQYYTSKLVTLLPTCAWLLLLFTLPALQTLILLF